MTECRDKLINFVSKFIGTVRFGNDHLAVIIGYKDLQIGNILISRVYYVEGLVRNLFSVGQVCDLDLKVAFRKHTCFVRNLEGVDLLSGSRGSNLYTISMATMMKSSPICLISKASKTKSWLCSGPDLHGLTSRHIMLYLPPIYAATLPPPDTAEASSSTSIDNDAPYLSSLPKNKTTSPPINSTNIKEPNNEEDAMFDNDTFTNPFAPIETSSAESSSRIVCYFHAFLVKEEPKSYKEAMIKSSWIESMQEEIHEFEQLKVWELVLRLDKVMIINLKWILKLKLDEYGSVLKNKARLVTKGLQISQSPRGIFINQSKCALEMLSKYGFEKCDPVDILMMAQSKLDEDPNGTLAKHAKKHLTAVKRVFRNLKGTINMGMWYSKDADFDLIAFVDDGHMRSQSTDYIFDYNKIPLYCDSQSAIALSYNTEQHSRTKHIVVRYHFIKEQVENEIVELYFVKSAYQQANLFT
ncbi:hypothetical protein Tco_0351259 [Tanacetum coccineum]